MQNKWIILYCGWDPHITEAMDWYEALLSHVIWCGNAREDSDKFNIYKKAFKGLVDMKEAIELYNMMHKEDAIEYMAKIDEEDYCNVR